MARGCGCASGSCSCQIIAGNGVTIQGTGTAENPFVVTATQANINQVLVFDDTVSTKFETTGNGTSSDPLRVSADIKLRVDDLVDVGPRTPVDGDALVYSGGTWAPAAVEGTGGGGGGGQLIADPNHPGFFLINPEGDLTADPDHPGFYLIGA